MALPGEMVDGAVTSDVGFKLAQGSAPLWMVSAMIGASLLLL
jgi:hypothetical protein